MTSVRLRLASNLAKVMAAKGLNNQRLSDLCREHDEVLHKTTIKNILEAKNWQSDSLDKLEQALGVSASTLLADELSEQEAKDAAHQNLTVNKDDVRWAYKRVDLMLDELGIDDLDYRADVFYEFVASAASEGLEKAQAAFLQKIAQRP